jgi:hypothetical protein
MVYTATAGYLRLPREGQKEVSSFQPNGKARLPEGAGPRRYREKRRDAAYFDHARETATALFA